MKSMPKVFVLAVVLLSMSAKLRADVFGTGENQFEIEFVTIGDPGNPGNPKSLEDETGAPHAFGPVDYVYPTFRTSRIEFLRISLARSGPSGRASLALMSAALLARRCRAVLRVIRVGDPGRRTDDFLRAPQKQACPARDHVSQKLFRRPALT